MHEKLPTESDAEAVSPHLFLGYLGSRACLRVLGLWKTTLYLGFLCCLNVVFFTALSAFSALPLASDFPAAQEMPIDISDLMARTWNALAPSTPATPV